MSKVCKCGSFAINKDPVRELCDVCYYKRPLLDLLAIIHGDGGQYTGEWGLSKSVKDAIKIVVENF